MTRPLIRCLGLAAAVLLLVHRLPAATKESKSAESEPFKRLTVEETSKLITDPSVRVYDGNSDDVYREGHIPGAVHLLSKDMKEGVLPADKSTTLVFYCHSER
ncbi:MAG TPA: rhodanese-like domain-containing protein [Candidatus Polarisedimenticolia bacterium]|jgi:3-mercaptopyruvate sulfurtransferase SseA|nr:rhodanese-like domain-containing protein [Candidatus Polarisedimenticolia bacterium]